MEKDADKVEEARLRAKAVKEEEAAVALQAEIGVARRAEEARRAQNIAKKALEETPKKSGVDTGSLGGIFSTVKRRRASTLKDYREIADMRPRRRRAKQEVELERVKKATEKEKKEKGQKVRSKAKKPKKLAAEIVEKRVR